MRIRNIEGMRGIAALIVLFSHLTVMYYPAAYWGSETLSHNNNADIFIGQSPLSVFFAGNSAVMIFLILTGFGTYFVHEKGKHAIIKFATLRFFKLTIPVVLSSLMVWLIFAFNLTFYENIIEGTGTLWFGDWYHPFNINFFKVLLHVFTETTSYNNTLWTMQYFFKGIFVVILLKSIWGYSSIRHFIYVMAIVIMINLQEKYYIPCILGLLLADLYTNDACNTLSNKKAIFLLVISLYFFGVPMYIKSELIMYRFLIVGGNLKEYYHIIGAFLLLFITLYWIPLKKIMEFKVFQFFGKYSMAIYMVHYPILISFSSWLYLRLILRYGYNFAVMITSCITIIITIIAAILFQSITGFAIKKIDSIYMRHIDIKLNQ